MLSADEIWKAVPGFDGICEASNLGRARTLDRFVKKTKADGTVVSLRVWGRLLIPTKVGASYFTVGVGMSNFYIHRLVAKAFIPNPENKPQVNHKNGNKADNRVENLEWMTDSENKTHKCRVLKKGAGNTHPMAKINENDVLDIRSIYSFGATQRAIARAYDLTQSTVSNIVNKRLWAHV